MYFDLRKILRGCKSQDWGPKLLFPGPEHRAQVGAGVGGERDEGVRAGSSSTAVLEKKSQGRCHLPSSCFQPFWIPSNIQLAITMRTTCAGCFNKYSQHVSLWLLAAFRRVGSDHELTMAHVLHYGCIMPRAFSQPPYYS